MPTINIVKFKIRRGSDSQRQAVTLDQGEIGYTTDTKRVFVGDGSTMGGNVAGNIVHAPISTAGGRTSETDAVQGDLIYERGLMYQLSGTDYSNLSAWGFVGSRGSTSIAYNSIGRLVIKDQGIGATMFATSAASTAGGITVNLTSGLSADVDNLTVAVSTNGIQIKDGGIGTTQLGLNSVDQYAIAASSLSGGLIGGGGAKLAVNVDDNTIAIVNNQLVVSAINVTDINTGGGLDTNGGVLSSTVAGVDGTSIILSAGSIANLPDRVVPGTYPFPKIIATTTGVISEISSGITASLTATNIAGNSPFVGYYDQQSLSAGGLSNQTYITCLTGDSASTITLSSGGFLLFDGAGYGTLAIPTFQVPNY
tara:strand:- start:6529 stop:7629 length:1101 start_codon:yes stop_codon:yes gene_type:complete